MPTPTIVVPGLSVAVACAAGKAVFRTRLGNAANLETLAFRPIIDSGVRLSLHPAGHILGSAQVRLESRGEVAVVTGDYKLGSDRTCAAFEPVRCDLFVTESTFGLPIYRWPSRDRLRRNQRLVASQPRRGED
jgi:putative mRNA 3-end processing factor